MRIELNYGRGMLPLDLPDDWDVTVIGKKPMTALTDPVAAVEAALAAPLAAPSLAEAARGCRSACILICDITRPVPNGLTLPPLIKGLLEAGIDAQAITVLVATGLHRPNEGDELAEVVGDPWVMESVRVENHFARDAAAHVDLGVTPTRGVRVLLDRRLVEADLKIATGLVEPHFMAGYSGGRKAVCPGLAAVETIRVAHGPAMLEGQIGPGIIEGNPLHKGLVQVLRKVGVDFLVNVALDRDRQIAGVFCGHPETAHLAGIEFVENESHVPLDDYVDFVITSGGGHPLDASFYQAIKGISAASAIVRPGGVILLCASLSEGVGSPSFEKLIRETANPEAFEAKLLDDQFFVVDQWMVQHLCQARRRARVLLYTGGLPFEAAGELLIEAVRSPAEGVALGLDHIGDNGRIAVIPQGPYVLATVRGQKRPLGDSDALEGNTSTH